MERGGTGVRTTRRVVTTTELMELLAAGKKVRLPAVAPIDPGTLENYPEVDRVAAASAGTDVGRTVASVEHVRDERVQCIRVADERHLYLTDGFVPTHNTNNIMFLKSTDDAMLDTLQKMSGTTHVGVTNSKTVTQDKSQMIKGLNVDGKVSYTMSTEERPVISYNDMAFIPERNSIVFRAGDAPVWNRNEMVLPMSWRLFKDTITHPGHKYTLQTIPTLSSALDFDVRLNQPNFANMLAKRMAQAERAEQAKKIYEKAYGYSEYDVTRLDPDVYSDEVMGLITTIAWNDLGVDPADMEEVLDPDLYDDPMFVMNGDVMMSQLADNTDLTEVLAEQSQRESDRKTKRYARSTISREMLLRGDGRTAVHQLDMTVVEAYKACKSYLEKDLDHFSVRGGDLCGVDGTTYITRMDDSHDLGTMQSASEDSGARVFSETDVEDPEVAEAIGSFVVHDAFYRYLASLDSWTDLGQGSFDREMALRMES